MNKFWGSFFRRLFITFLVLFVILFCLYVPKFLFGWLKLSGEDKTINVYAFVDNFPHELIERFQKETGISVRIRLFDTNEELLAKFKISKGEGYDLITPSDYMVEILRKEKLLHKIDCTRLKNISNLDERFLNKKFDPHNRYSIPFAWTLYGIIYDTKVFGEEEVGFRQLFERPADHRYKVGMLDDALDSFFLAAIYLFQKTDKLTRKEILKIEELLIKQKEWVECYASSTLEYFLLSETIPLAIVPGYMAVKILKSKKNFKFVLPKEGTLITIENLAIPTSSKKVDLVYQFIDFMISKEAVALNSFNYGFNPLNKKAYSLPGMNFFRQNSLFPSDDIFGKLHIISNSISLDTINNIWLKVRAF